MTRMTRTIQRMTVLVAVVMALALFGACAGGSGDDSAHDRAADTVLRYMRAANTGDVETIWALLHPDQRAGIDKAHFVACNTGNGAIQPKMTFAVTDTADSDHDGYDAVRVTVEITVAGETLVRPSHAYYHDGDDTYYIRLLDDVYNAYASGACTA